MQSVGVLALQGSFSEHLTKSGAADGGFAGCRKNGC